MYLTQSSVWAAGAASLDQRDQTLSVSKAKFQTHTQTHVYFTIRLLKVAPAAGFAKAARLLVSPLS